uniref:Uncharacterized protein n=1 Tax=Parastrongyloides trichosuri TaxID=131310 RepID=A0A0N4ZJZ1_PARTI
MHDYNIDNINFPLAEDEIKNDDSIEVYGFKESNVIDQSNDEIKESKNEEEEKNNSSVKEKKSDEVKKNIINKNDINGPLLHNLSSYIDLAFESLLAYYRYIKPIIFLFVYL